MTPRSVIVQYDPSGLYTPGAQFTMLDLAAGIQQEVWPINIVFTIKGRLARMWGKVLIREDDGYILRTRRGQSRYEWTVPQQ